MVALLSVADVGLAAVKALRPEGLCEAHVLLVRLALLLHNDLVVLLGVEAPGTVHHLALGHSASVAVAVLAVAVDQAVCWAPPCAIVATNYMEAMLGMMSLESCTVCLVVMEG